MKTDADDLGKGLLRRKKKKLFEREEGGSWIEKCL